jgi:uncharacterized membrane protein YdbT with pleckstrin-like domain
MTTTRHPVSILTTSGLPVAGTVMIALEYATARYDLDRVFLLGAIVLVVALLILNVGRWMLSTVSLTDEFLIERDGPFAESQIPLHAIQDARLSRPFLGLLFGYGTLTVLSGRTSETLAYLPNPVSFLKALDERMAPWRRVKE